MRHADIWRALDRLAERNGLSASGLAKRAGLDATAFNKSKRTSADGSPRWLSTETLSKALDAVGASLEDFAALAGGRQGQRAPMISLAKAAGDGFFDDAGFPTGEGWGELRLPGLGDETVYVLEITGDLMEPVYRRGDKIVAAPGMGLRRGDRVVVKTKAGEVFARVLGRQSDRTVELIPLNPAHPPRELPRSDLAWMARILWASQ